MTLATRIMRLERQAPTVADDDESPYGWAHNCRKIIECCERMGPVERYMKAALLYLFVERDRGSAAHPDLWQRWQRLKAGEVVNAGPRDAKLEEDAECATRTMEQMIVRAKSDRAHGLE